MLPLYRALFATLPAIARPMPIFPRVLNSRADMITLKRSTNCHTPVLLQLSRCSTLKADVFLFKPKHNV